MAEGRVAVAALLLLLVLGCAPSRAEPEVDCAKAQTTPEIALCADRDYRTADKALNAAYREMLAAVDAATAQEGEEAKLQRRSWREAVIEAQRRWIAFRDADCAAVGTAWMGGTGMGAAVSTCLAEATRARALEMKRRAREGN